MLQKDHKAANVASDEPAAAARIDGAADNVYSTAAEMSSARAAARPRRKGGFFSWSSNAGMHSCIIDHDYYETKSSEKFLAK